ncbi:MAG: glycoside hydrolase family 172 protein [Saprospiraceae bacterium]
MNHKILLFLFLLSFAGNQLHGQELFQMPIGKQTRWVSFENRSGQKGAGGLENRGAKGHAFDHIKAGGSIDLVNMEGSGTVRRIWMTISQRDPEMLRSLRLEMFWDGSDKPAVSAPLGDFFGEGLGQKVPFESALFADPEGRSFNCFVPMPFREGARITISNDADKDLIAIFYDVDILLEEHQADMLYFHTYWSRSLETALAEDFEILPQVEGAGRFLGTNIGVLTNEAYEDTWWGEGEVKIYLDGDQEEPTLVGSGTEDYIGTAYGQGTYDHLYQGSLIADSKTGQFAFYRYHIPDPVFFDNNIKVTIQQIGGAPKDRVIKFLAKGVELQPISIHNDLVFTKLLEREQPLDLKDPDLPQGWTNFYRRDDVSATAYFYLDQPTNTLPAIGDLQNRTAQLRSNK